RQEAIPAPLAKAARTFADADVAWSAVVPRLAGARDAAVRGDEGAAEALTAVETEYEAATDAWWNAFHGYQARLAETTGHFDLRAPAEAHTLPPLRLESEVDWSGPVLAEYGAPPPDPDPDPPAVFPLPVRVAPG